MAFTLPIRNHDISASARSTAAGFLPALIWATILAIALWPLYERFAKRVTAGPSSLAASIFTCCVALILFTPMALAIYQAAEQSGEITQWMKKAGESGVSVTPRPWRWAVLVVESRS